MTLPEDLLPDLNDGLRRLGLDDPGLSARLLDYLGLLVQWNRTYNLTAIRDPREMLVKHLLDSLAMHRHVGPGRLADLGAGAGLPGIPLALAVPGLEVTLVESAGKKARFMREVKRRLGIEAIEVVEGRAEALDRPGHYDCLVARALGTLAMILDIGGHLLAPAGRLLAMKGAIPHEEIAALPPGWAVSAIEPLTVPGLAAERHLLVVTRQPHPPPANTRTEPA
ncbi:MAG: 16S rRNA (guanine(527)-N(7))-methyltransferase RsmG [Lysobacteraceae bacterium]